MSRIRKRKKFQQLKESKKMMIKKMIRKRKKFQQLKISKKPMIKKNLLKFYKEANIAINFQMAYVINV